jgi:cytoskeleton protein RodZ
MAGGAVQGSMIGVGSALRKARERRGITLDAASRDTKLHIDQLRAMEAEDFEAMLGDVYVRGSLRTYAQYLGLSADKVIGAYAEHTDEPAPPPPPARLGRVERAMAATRIRDNQRLMVFLAGTVLVIAVVFGLVSRGYSAPQPANLPTVAAEPEPLDREIDAVVQATAGVQITVTADGVLTTYTMEAGETRTFRAETDMVLSMSDCGAVQLTVNGVDNGSPGSPGLPCTKPFNFDGSAGATPSTGG